ncbi:hypothetical protein [Bosea sp. 7B]|uniref:hypothetical protein n=1 Tax=Bosea sp. 7B TaxID=2768850 RepID=UPI00191BBCAB|nr:hypothetical protein [Bosea sp. 7B]
MPQKKHKPEEIVAKLRQVDVRAGTAACEAPGAGAGATWPVGAPAAGAGFEVAGAGSPPPWAPDGLCCCAGAVSAGAVWARATKLATGVATMAVASRTVPIKRCIELGPWSCGAPP